MSRWKALPESLDPQVRQLVVHLRRLKDHSGLNLKSLEAKTGYSRSSWERYLNGRNLPPSQAVEELARVCGTDPTRLLALHEVAAACWGQGGQAAEQEGQEGREGQERREGRELLLAPVPAHRLPKRLLLVAAGAAAGALVALLVTEPWHESVSLATAHAGAPASYTCHIHRKDGRWYAGQSTTRDDLVQFGDTGPAVAEVQCLLKRAGFSPGGIDGIFGELTERAVKREQTQAKLVVDGMVGPHTWAALRA
ncbi:peptidoglycan-binding protein [Streptomyces sp. NPDC002588]|uniref:peptidoglycan-binding protein n=1 Tax=Streptomyces sp. NPDC002588 TaxID=3154419 RepID=UPI00333109CF